MQTLQEATGQDTAARHAKFLSNVSRHLMSLDLDPMLEAVGHSALPLLGDVCVIDRVTEGSAARLLEVRNGAETWIEPPEELASISRGEVRVDGNRSRLTVPIVVASERFGAFTFVAKGGLVHGPAELGLAQELADRVGLAIRNIREHLKLREALVDREKLISIAAHELRGPVCSLRLCVQALRRMERAVPSKGTRLLEIMDREERRLARLIDEEIDLADSLVGRWDRSRLDQVVTNLVTNALKFGQKRPIYISAGAAEDGTCARFSVTDQGLGIPAEAQQRIFEPFKRAPMAARHEGLGLGLYIVRNIVAQLGGIVQVTSAPGCGATFTVELPLDSERYERATGT